MSLDTWEGSLAKIPGYCTHLNISKGEKLYDQKIKTMTEFMDSKTASPLLSSTPYYQFYLATGTCCVMLLWKEPFGKRNPFFESNCSRIDTWHDACALFCLNALPINMLFSIPERSLSKGYNFSSLVFRCYLTLLNQLFSVFWRGWHAICQMDQIRWLRPKQRNTIRIHWTSLFLRNSTLSLSPTCRFIVGVEECHFCSENIGRWSRVITPPLNHLTLAVMGLQEGGVKTQMPFYTRAGTTSLPHS